MDFGIVLSAKQCIETDHDAIVSGYYHQAVDWMGAALNKITKGDATSDLNLKKVEIELETAKMVVSPAKLKF